MNIKPLVLATSMALLGSQAVIAAPDFDKIKADPVKPKNVIVLIGDGMGVGQIEIARHMEYGKAGTLFLESLPNVALVRTYSANKQVTDSAAAGTALATAVKTNNAAIGVDQDGNEVDSILDDFQKKGRKVGVISTNTVTDATPAAFTASVANRYQGQPEAARQMLKNRYDVLLGGGWKYFGPKKQDGVDLLPKYEEAGYTIVKDKDQLAAAKGADKLLGLFHKSYMNYKQDRDDVGSQEPSLELMTEMAIDTLKKDKDGFFLMVEGARIDHAAHAADVTGVWKEMMEFDRTVEQTWNWAKDRKDTLVVVLADHETMGLSVTEPMDIPALKKISVSPEYMAGKLVKAEDGKSFTIDSIKSVFKEYAGFEVTDAQAEELNKNSLSSKGKLKYQYKIGWEIGSMIAEHYQAGAIDRAVRANSSTGGHSSNMVPLFAAGPGSQYFEGVLNNTDVPKLIRTLTSK
ncbi:alkaline phosphatase [Vibrio sp. SCSIO 43137]|uniref:alkaline phosphatase n=1 Tax=Vibrio sp. SCSIO 43137 TaxID=3021011 RepID=UPI00230810DD|nr:alkaline phosphatase [Vibrio sp. SCSIO 43137]WCE30253.1 alkaline phosphatase [Vibrio sp. SCSIO 43137]